VEPTILLQAHETQKCGLKVRLRRPVHGIGARHLQQINLLDGHRHTDFIFHLNKIFKFLFRIENELIANVNYKFNTCMQNIMHGLFYHLIASLKNKRSVFALRNIYVWVLVLYTRLESALHTKTFWLFTEKKFISK
jgi:hypothetical protein